MNITIHVFMGIDLLVYVKHRGCKCAVSSNLRSPTVLFQQDSANLTITQFVQTFYYDGVSFIGDKTNEHSRSHSHTYVIRISKHQSLFHRKRPPPMQTKVYMSNDTINTNLVEIN